MTVRIFYETQEAADLLNQLRKGRPRTFFRREVDQVLSTFRRPNATSPVASVAQSANVSTVVPPVIAPPVAPPAVSPPAAVEPPRVKIEPPVTKPVPTPPVAKAEPAKPAGRSTPSTATRQRRPRAARADEVADTLGDFFNTTGSSLLDFEKTADPPAAGGPAIAASVPEVPKSPVLPTPPAVIEPEAVGASVPEVPKSPVLPTLPAVVEPEAVETVETGQIVAMGEVDALRLSIRTSTNQQHAGVRTETSAGFFRRVLKKDAAAESKPAGDLSLVGGGLILEPAREPAVDVPATVAASVPEVPKSPVLPTPPAAVEPEAVETVETGAIVAMGEVDALRLSIRTSTNQQHAGVRTETSAGFFRRVLKKDGVAAPKASDDLALVGGGLTLEPVMDVPAAVVVQAEAAPVVAEVSLPEASVAKAPPMPVAEAVEFVESGAIVAMGEVDALRLSIRTSTNQQHAGVRTETSAGFFRRVLKKDGVAAPRASDDLALVGGGLTLDPVVDVPAPVEVKAQIPAVAVEPVAEAIAEAVPESGEVVAFGQTDRLRLSVRTGSAQQHAGIRPETSAGFFRRVVGKAEATEGEQRIGTRDANNVVNLEESEFLDPDVVLPEPTPEPSLAELVKKPSVPAGVRTETTSGFFRRVVGQAG